MGYDDDYEEPTTKLKPVKAPKVGCITITLDMDRYLSGGTLENLIAENLTTQLKRTIESSIQASVEKQVSKLVDKEFQKIAKEKLEEVFTKPQKKTNSWGEPVGEAVSFREILLQKMTNYLDEKVQEDGRTPSYDRDKYPTRAQQILRKVALEPLDAAVKEKVAEIAAAAKEQVKNAVARYISEQLAPTINVPQLKS